MNFRTRKVGLIFLFALSGCSSLGGSEPEIRKSLVDVVDAVQYAVEEAARHFDKDSKDDPWRATKAELNHWGAACKHASEEATKACSSMLDDADRVCRAACASGSCGAAFVERCKRLSEGGDQAALCPSGDRLTGAWCTSAKACNVSRETAGSLCKGLKSLRIPELKEAKLSLAVQQSADAAAKVSILVVSFGGSHSRVATNTVEMLMLPRIRSSDYGSGPVPPLPLNRTISDEAKKLAAELKALIIDAVGASTREYEGSDPNATKTAARPPMALGVLDVIFSLVIDSSGKLGLKKEFATPAVSIDISGGGGRKTTNTLRITYARQD